MALLVLQVDSGFVLAFMVTKVIGFQFVAELVLLFPREDLGFFLVIVGVQVIGFLPQD
jgi:hypothetical protein